LITILFPNEWQKLCHIFIRKIKAKQTKNCTTKLQLARQLNSGPRNTQAIDLLILALVKRIATYLPVTFAVKLCSFSRIVYHSSLSLFSSLLASSSKLRGNIQRKLS